MRKNFGFFSGENARACEYDIMPAKKMTVHAKARKANPDSANRPKTRVAGSTKKNTRMRPVLSDAKAKKAKARLNKS